MLRYTELDFGDPEIAKTVQVVFVVKTVIIQYCVYYEIYLNSLY